MVFARGGGEVRKTGNGLQGARGRALHVLSAVKRRHRSLCRRARVPDAVTEPNKGLWRGCAEVGSLPGRVCVPAQVIAAESGGDVGFGPAMSVGGNRECHIRGGWPAAMSRPSADAQEPTARPGPVLCCAPPRLPRPCGLPGPSRLGPSRCRNSKRNYATADDQLAVCVERVPAKAGPG